MEDLVCSKTALHPESLGIWATSHIQIGFKCKRSLKKIYCQYIGMECVIFTHYLAKANVVGEREVAESDLLELLKK